MYIADIAVDEEYVYISKVTILNNDMAQRAAYSLAIVDGRIIKDKTISIINYTEKSPKVITTLTKAKTISQTDYILDYENPTGKYDYDHPIILESVSDCEIFVDEHTNYGMGFLVESALCTMQDFAEYDETFFESNLLILYPVYDWIDDPIANNQFMQTRLYEDHIITTFHYTVIHGGISLERTELNLYCIPIPRDQYHGQRMSTVFCTDIKELG